MSQEKVDRYKQEKANRKKNLQKAKRKRLAAYSGVVLVVVLIAAWITYSGINSYTRSQAAQKTPVNLNAITDYMTGLNAPEEDNASE